MPEMMCGACCGDVRLALSADEVERLASAGTTLTEILPAFRHFEYEGYVLEENDEDLFSWSANTESIEAVAAESSDENGRFWFDVAEHAKQLQPMEGLYAMIGRCGFLKEDNSCGDYENRPRICREFRPGSKPCIDIRKNRASEVTVRLRDKTSLV